MWKNYQSQPDLIKSLKNLFIVLSTDTLAKFEHENPQKKLFHFCLTKIECVYLYILIVNGERERERGQI